MRLLLGELAPVPGEVGENLAAVERAVRSSPCDLAVFPEMFLSGYRLGDRVHALALREGDESFVRLARLARESSTALLLGAPVASGGRAGEVENAALLFAPDGSASRQVKRYLPNFGPFDEALTFTPTDRSHSLRLGARKLGVEICYDVFFPEVSRELALDGSEILVAISASPVTSRRLFERLLPARAIENGLPVVYVNRVGVEDGLVFGGGSGVWDPRGEPVPLVAGATEPREAEERLLTAEVDLDAARRWRPFRPVLRDVASRPPASGTQGS